MPYQFKDIYTGNNIAEEKSLSGSSEFPLEELIFNEECIYAYI